MLALYCRFPSVPTSLWSCGLVNHVSHGGLAVELEEARKVSQNQGEPELLNSHLIFSRISAHLRGVLPNRVISQRSSCHGGWVASGKISNVFGPERLPIWSMQPEETLMTGVAEISTLYPMTGWQEELGNAPEQYRAPWQHAFLVIFQELRL